MSENNKVGFGLTTWNEDTNKYSGDFNSDLPRLPFMRLQDGINLVRIVTMPYKYYQIRYKSPKDKGFGRRVATAWPAHQDCPAKLAGFQPRPRYLVGIIDRADESIKILDMSELVYEQLKKILKTVNATDKSGKEHTASEFDLNINFDSKAKAATNFYQVMKMDSFPMTENDVALVSKLGDSLHEILTRHSTPPSPETVKKRMEALGWTGEPAPKKEKKDKKEEEGSANLKEAEATDYTFERPAAEAN
jgi:hypothetical protein